MRTRSLALAAALMLLLVAPAQILATDGYFTLGYGTRSQGMGGTGVAFPLGTMSPATNPAGLALGDGGWELGVGLFNPNRAYEVTGIPSGYPGTVGLAPGKFESGSKLFPIPHFGFAKRAGANAMFGIAMYGNGGMNTNYSAKTFGFSPVGVNLSQLFIAPTYAARFGGKHAIGVTGLIGYQMFEAKGLQAFSAFSSDPTKLTNNGNDSSMGFGVRVGYLGQLSKQFAIGASYQSRIAMGEFKKYAGLYAEQGDFDIPSNWTVGVAITPNDKVRIAVDVQQMRYSEVKSVGNPMLPNLMQAPLGADGGAGFGWDDMTAVKFGIEHRVSDSFTWRAGYAYGQQPIPSSEVLFNILAPGVIEQHATFGFSKAVGDGKNLDFALTRAFNKNVSGPNPLEVPGLQTITLGMDQWVFTVGYAVRFK
jgi:long-chain fatty acid transport protein